MRGPVPGLAPVHQHLTDPMVLVPEVWYRAQYLGPVPVLREEVVGLYPPVQQSTTSLTEILGPDEKPKESKMAIAQASAPVPAGPLVETPPTSAIGYWWLTGVGSCGSYRIPALSLGGKDSLSSDHGGAVPDGTGEWCWEQSDQCCGINAGFPFDSIWGLSAIATLASSAGSHLVGDGGTSRDIRSRAAWNAFGVDGSASLALLWLSFGGESNGIRLSGARVDSTDWLPLILSGSAWVSLCRFPCNH